MVLLVAATASRARAGATGEVPGFVESNGKLVFDDPFPEDRPRATGLQHRFPEMFGLAEHPLNAEKIELGRLLFFDPVLSGDHTLSCATCHNPDYGFADGRPLGMGIGGTGSGPERTGGRKLSRNTPTIWNAAFDRWQFWDGRAEGLEAQAPVPLTNPDEMAADPDRVVAELRGIPEYVERFERAFDDKGAEAITFDRTVEALTSFERTLLSYNSKFDRYAAGDFTTLNDSEKNGLKLFRSLNTRCFECHSFPTFNDGSFRVLGVPDEGDPDLGRGGVVDHEVDSTFKVPSLRNVALTAPYMHNGSLATLEDVIKFYSEGGGRREKSPVARIDGKIRKFDITPEQSADLVAFLKALTDTSRQPEAPQRVPSGLAVVPVNSSAVPAPALAGNSEPPTPQAARPSAPGVVPTIRLPPGAETPLEIVETVQMRRVPPAGNVTKEIVPALPAMPPATFHVFPGQSIQAAVDRAKPGDRIEIAPGVYSEMVEITTPDLTLAGTAEGDDRPVLDGGMKLEAGIVSSVPGTTLIHLVFRDYLRAGVVTKGPAMPNIDDLLIRSEAENSKP